MNLNFFEYELAPGESHSITTTGRFIRGMAADAPYSIRMGDGSPTDFETGIAFESPRPFDRIEIINSHTALQTIRIAVADGFVDDNRLVGQVDISGGIRLAGNKTATAGAVTVDTAAILIIAAATDRARCLIQNLGSSAIYLGPDSGVDVANGIQVPAGGSASVTLQTDIYAISATAGQDVRFLGEAL